jgi:hypothetical protein
MGIALADNSRSKAGAMIKNVPIILRGWRNWVRAALQPATLLYVFVIPVLWAALAAIYVSPTAILAALLIFGYFLVVRHRMGLAAREDLIAKQKSRFRARQHAARALHVRR